MDLRWVWSEALTNPALESSVGVGGFGYPVCWIGVGWAGGDWEVVLAHLYVYTFSIQSMLLLF